MADTSPLSEYLASEATPNREFVAYLAALESVAGVVPDVAASIVKELADQRGNLKMIAALGRIKSYLDYGIFQPVQIAAIHALNSADKDVREISETYRSRRDALVDGLARVNWLIRKPKATMFVWAEIPAPYRSMGSMEFSKFLLNEARVAVSPGIGFGQYGDQHVRFALIENEHRTRQAVRTIRKAMDVLPE